MASWNLTDVDCQTTFSRLYQQYLNHQGSILSMIKLILTFVVALGGCLADGHQFGSEAKTATALEIIIGRGFASEYFSIDTQGASLDVLRLINPLADQNTLNKYPVLYGHGLLFDASSMLSRGEHSRPRKPVLGVPTIKYPTPGDSSDDTALPFALSNNNFDVWMFDARGSSQLNRNESIQTNPSKSQKFWDFSLDEQGLVDLPKLIDFVLYRTGAEKLIYVAYSESTLFMFELLSTMPEYADKLAAFVAMAPVAYVGHVSGIAPPALAPILAIPDFLNYNSVPQPVLDAVDNSIRVLCKNRLGSELFCTPLINGIGGKGNSAAAPSFYSHLFHSTSLKAIKHFLQLYLGKRFAMYDYGPVGNMAHYGTMRNPDYQLKRIRSDRIILIRGLNDILSTPPDQEHLLRELRVRPFLDMPIPNYNHFDFIDGKDVISKVNQPIMEVLYKILYLDGPQIFRSAYQKTGNRPYATIPAALIPKAPKLSVIPWQSEPATMSPTSIFGSALLSPVQNVVQSIGSLPW